jgi:hypothetical protein
MAHAAMARLNLLLLHRHISPRQWLYCARGVWISEKCLFVITIVSLVHWLSRDHSLSITFSIVITSKLSHLYLCFQLWFRWHLHRDGSRSFKKIFVAKWLSLRFRACLFSLSLSVCCTATAHSHDHSASFRFFSKSVFSFKQRVHFLFCNMGRKARYCAFHSMEGSGAQHRNSIICGVTLEGESTCNGNEQQWKKTGIFCFIVFLRLIAATANGCHWHGSFQYCASSSDKFSPTFGETLEKKKKKKKCAPAFAKWVFVRSLCFV